MKTQHWWLALATLLLLSIVFACQPNVDSEPYDFPSSYPEMFISDDNAFSEKKAALGKQLFFDKNLSIDSTIACASCHLTDYAYSDTLALSTGVHGRIGDRNSPSLIYSGFAPLINKDGGVVKLDIQALIPIEDHNEMGIHILKLAERLEQDYDYAQSFEEAFGRSPDPFTIPRALAHFVRTLPSPSSPFDNYQAGELDSLSQAAINGMELFMSDRLNCVSCHKDPLFSTFEFAHNGLYSEYEDIGRALITSDSTDIGKFKIPSLKNIALTAPYMHDGSLSTLREVIRHYASGGKPHANKDKRISGFELSEKEMTELLAFLNSLTDVEFE